MGEIMGDRFHSCAVNHTIRYWSVDVAGNIEPVRVFAVMLAPNWSSPPV